VIGRAISGLGAAGIFTGASTAVAQIASLKWRPLILGLVGAMYGLCSVAGPLVSLFRVSPIMSNF
jgi:MFS family permease